VPLAGYMSTSERPRNLEPEAVEERCQQVAIPKVASSAASLIRSQEPFIRGAEISSMCQMSHLLAYPATFVKLLHMTAVCSFGGLKEAWFH